MIKIYVENNVLVVDHGSSNIQYYTDTNTWFIQQAGTDSLMIYSIAQTKFEKHQPYKIIAVNTFSVFQDKVGVDLGVDLATTIVAITQLLLSVQSFPSNIIHVESLSDFPTPVAGYIPLADNTIYDIHGIVDIGANGINFNAVNSKIKGTFILTDGITSTKTGDFIIGTNSDISLELVTLTNSICTNLIAINGTGAELIFIDSVIMNGANNVGYLNNFNIALIEGLSIDGFANGILLTGINNGILMRALQFINISGGTFIDFGTSTFKNVEINGLIGDTPVGGVGINIAPNGANIIANGSGIIASTRIDATVGDAITGYSTFDLDWNVHGNSGILSSDRLLPTGWGFYQDGETTPITQVITTVPQKLSIDGVGAQTEEGFLPNSIRGNSALWDVVNNKITPISIGDSYDVGIDLEIIAKSGGVGQIELVVDIGGAVGITIPIITADSFVGKTPPFTKRINLLMFSLATFIANGGQIFLSTDTGTATIATRQITISRNSSGAS